MKLLALVRTILLAAGLLLATPQAQAQILGGTLYTAMPGPVSMQLVEDRSALSINWGLPLYWRTGPLDFDYAVSTGERGAPPDLTKQFGRYNAGGRFENSPAWSNNAPGTIISSPALPAGNVVMLGSGIFPNYDPSTQFVDSQFMVHTGDIPVGLITLRPNRLAAVFPGANHTVSIGFDSSPFPGIVSSNFADYAIRVIVSNVCVR